MYVNSFIVYALCDARTHQVRYVGCSEIGLSRPLNLSGYKNNAELDAWLRDLRVCGSEPVILVLAQAADIAGLRAAEKYWIGLGRHFGWPLSNKVGFSLDIVEPDALMPKGKRWEMKAWRRDPEVRAALSAARESTRQPARRGKGGGRPKKY